MDGPVLLGRALGQQNVLPGIHQEDVALGAQGDTAVLKQNRLGAEFKSFLKGKKDQFNKDPKLFRKEALKDL